MIRRARTSLLRHDHPASRIRALATGRRDQLQLFGAVLDLRRAPAWEASAELTENPREDLLKRVHQLGDSAGISLAFSSLDKDPRR